MMRPMGKNNGRTLGQVCGWTHADALLRGKRFYVLDGDYFQLFQIFLNYVLINEESDLSRNDNILGRISMKAFINILKEKGKMR